MIEDLNKIAQEFIETFGVNALSKVLFEFKINLVNVFIPYLNDDISFKKDHIDFVEFQSKLTEALEKDPENTKILAISEFCLFIFKNFNHANLIITACSKYQISDQDIKAVNIILAKSPDILSQQRTHVSEAIASCFSDLELLEKTHQGFNKNLPNVKEAGSLLTLKKKVQAYIDSSTFQILSENYQKLCDQYKKLTHDLNELKRLMQVVSAAKSYKESLVELKTGKDFLDEKDKLIQKLKEVKVVQDLKSGKLLQGLKKGKSIFFPDKALSKVSDAFEKGVLKDSADKLQKVCELLIISTCGKLDEQLNKITVSPTTPYNSVEVVTHLDPKNKHFDTRFEQVRNDFISLSKCIDEKIAAIKENEQEEYPAASAPLSVPDNSNELKYPIITHENDNQLKAAFIKEAEKYLDSRYRTAWGKFTTFLFRKDDLAWAKMGLAKCFMFEVENLVIRADENNYEASSNLLLKYQYANYALEELAESDNEKDNETLKALAVSSKAFPIKRDAQISSDQATNFQQVLQPKLTEIMGQFDNAQLGQIVKVGKTYRLGKSSGLNRCFKECFVTLDKQNAGHFTTAMRQHSKC